MKHFTFLCVILTLYSSERVRANLNPPKVDILLGKMKNLVEIYNEQLDKRVQWNVLNEAIESNQEVFENYEGKAKENMKELLHENAQAHDQYLFAVGPLFQWCGSVNFDIPRILSIVQRKNLPNIIRSHIKNRTRDLLLGGVNKSIDSINHILQAIQHMVNLTILINITEMKINEDFQSTGFYGIQRTKLENVVEGFGFTELEISELKTTFGKVVEWFGFLFLDLKIECRKIDKAVRDELMSINELANAIQTPQLDDMMDPDSLFSSLFVESMDKLSESCKKYVDSHKSTSSRRRRQVVADKDTSKLRRKPVTPVNHYFDESMVLNENYGATHDMVFANLKEFFGDRIISHLL